MKNMIGIIMHFCVVLMGIYGLDYFGINEFYYQILTTVIFWVFIDYGSKLRSIK